MSQNDSRDVVILQYGQLAMQYSQSQDAALRAELNRIEQELGMTSQEIMARVQELATRSF